MYCQEEPTTPITTQEIWNLLLQHPCDNWVTLIQLLHKIHFTFSPSLSSYNPQISITRAYQYIGRTLHFTTIYMTSSIIQKHHPSNNHISMLIQQRYVPVLQSTISFQLRVINATNYDARFQYAECARHCSITTRVNNQYISLQWTLDNYPNTNRAFFLSLYTRKIKPHDIYPSCTHRSLSLSRNITPLSPLWKIIYLDDENC